MTKYIMLRMDGLRSTFPDLPEEIAAAVDTTEQTAMARTAMAVLDLSEAHVWYAPQETLAEAEAAGFEGAYRTSYLIFATVKETP